VCVKNLLLGTIKKTLKKNGGLRGQWGFGLYTIPCWWGPIMQGKNPHNGNKKQKTFGLGQIGRKGMFPKNGISGRKIQGDFGRGLMRAVDFWVCGGGTGEASSLS